MKKFLIALIFLIPVIVIVAIQGTGAVIEAWAPAVNAESIEIRDGYNDYIGGGRIIIPRYFTDGSDGSEYIYINVYPNVVFSDEVGYTVSEEEGYDGECILEHVSKTKYKLIAKKNGSVLMKIYSVTNENAYKMLNVYITSDLITDINIFADDSDSIQRVAEDADITLASSIRLYAYAYPAEAIGKNLTTWQSSDNGIATVDKNGVVTATGKGKAKITCYLKDKTGTEHFSFIHVVVEEEILLKAEQLFLDRAFFTALTEEGQKSFVLENVIKKFGKHDEVLPLTEEDIIRTLVDKDFIEFEIDGKPLRIDFTEYDAIALKSNYLNEIYLENGGYTLIPQYKDFRRKEMPNVVYHISDSSILSVENGSIIPHKEGVCTVYAERNGHRTDSLTLTVKTRVISFQMPLSNFDNKRGIKQERIWGQYFFEGELIQNSFTLGYQTASVHPFSNCFDLLWESDSLFAEIDQNGKITFLDGCANQTISVTATAVVHGIKTELSRRYTFFMADEDVINVYNLLEAERAYSDETGRNAIALQSDIAIDAPHTLYVTNNLHGNGFLLNFKYPDGIFKYDDALSVKDDRFNVNNEYYILENFTVQSDESFEKGKYKSNNIYMSNMKIDGTVRYVISRYGWNSLHITKNKGTLTVEGCIFGATGFAAIYFSDDHFTSPKIQKGTLIVKNVVMRETDCASLVTTPNSFEPDIKDNYVQNIVFEGFMDSYNWKKVEELQGIFNAIDDGMLGPLREARDFLSNLLGNMLEEYFSVEPYKSAVYTDSAGQRWVSMNMFALGLCQTVDPATFDFTKNSEFYLVPVQLNKTSSNLLKRIVGFDMDLPCYLLSYKFDETRGPVIRPQDSCPENEQLFSRLHPGPSDNNNNRTKN